MKQRFARDVAVIEAIATQGPLLHQRRFRADAGTARGDH